MFVGVVRKVRAELGRVYGQGHVFGVVRTVQSLKASVCVCVFVWDCKNGTKLSCDCDCSCAWNISFKRRVVGCKNDG